VQVQIELREEGKDVPMRMSTTDLSRGGCYVELMMTMPVGTYVNAALWLNNCSIRVRGRVVTRHPQFGNGIMFLEFENPGEKVLAQYLDAINANPALPRASLPDCPPFTSGGWASYTPRVDKKFTFDSSPVQQNGWALGGAPGLVSSHRKARAGSP
jgi:hypothetical protein